MPHKLELSAGVAVIGGTGLNRLPELQIVGERIVLTPYGEASAPLVFGRLNGRMISFLARHGEGHKLPPHRINYRANVFALKEVGVKRVVAVAAVGSMHRKLSPGRIAIPDQLIDYTWGRAHSFADGGEAAVQHAEFGQPYSEALCQALLTAARKLRLGALAPSTYGCAQGPRLETEAEIRRMRRDGCDMVGMTGMPEAALARELELDYACIAVCVNWAAGLGKGGIHDQIEQSLKAGMERVLALLESVLPQL
ncbi:MAG: S-methyl-5'-thioinosine phosphorylase [Nevskiales bacterium]